MKSTTSFYIWLTITLIFLSITNQIKLTDIKYEKKTPQTINDADLTLTYEENSKLKLENLLESKYEKILKESVKQDADRMRKLNDAATNASDQNDASIKQSFTNNSIIQPAINSDTADIDKQPPGYSIEAKNFEKIKRTAQKRGNSTTSIVIDSHGHQLLQESFSAIDQQSDYIHNQLVELSKDTVVNQNGMSNSQTETVKTPLLMSEFNNNKDNQVGTDNNQFIPESKIQDDKNIDHTNILSSVIIDQKDAFEPNNSSVLASQPQYDDSSIIQDQSLRHESHIAVSPVVVLNPSENNTTSNKVQTDNGLITQVHNEKQEELKHIDESDISKSEKKADEVIIESHRDGDITVQTKDQINTVTDVKATPVIDKKKATILRIFVMGFVTLLMVI